MSGTYLEPWGFFLTYALGVSHFIYSTPHHLCYQVGKTSMYKLEKYSGHGIYLCFVYLLRYKVIILEYYLVTRNELLVGYNQTSSFIKSSAPSLILVKAYWLNDKGSSSYSLVMVKVY